MIRGGGGEEDDDDDVSLGSAGEWPICMPLVGLLLYVGVPRTQA